jgi:hypothetical protein
MYPMIATDYVPGLCGLGEKIVCARIGYQNGLSAYFQGPRSRTRQMEPIMIKQALARTSIVWQAATLGAGAPLARYHVADEMDANPTDDGSIIIECMALGDRASAEVGESRDASTPLLVTLPRRQLGPSSCWSGEHKGS